MRTTMTRKGQIVIPSHLRRKYGIEEGTQIQVIDEGERLVLKPITADYVRRLRGSLKGKRGMKALIRERQQEKDR